MQQLVLITGGAGFIGSHLADELLAQGYRVRALDNLTPQVHGSPAQRPAYLDPEVELVVGDVLDRETVDASLEGVDIVFHLAAAVGVGQSMYQLAHYTRTNNVGTAVLLEALVEHPVARLVVASSMSLYGEGLYEDAAGRVRVIGERPIEQLRQARWDPLDESGEALRPLPTPEDKPPTLSSIYALSKFDQERMALLIGRAYGIPTTALRFFNAYGPRQALSNPYTGVLAIFAARLLNEAPPQIFEDGEQQRDFVHVRDLALGCRLAMECDAAAGEVFNIGSGQPIRIVEVARELARVMGRPQIEPLLTGKYRAGDIRHCYADLGKSLRVLGYAPRIALQDGMAELAAWLEGQAAVDRVAQASAELAARGLAL